MTIIKTVKENEIIYALEGRLDSVTSPELESELEPELNTGCHDITLDINQVQYISSAGLRIFLIAHKKCVKNSKVFSITGANQAVREIFDITGYSAMLNIV